MKENEIGYYAVIVEKVDKENDKVYAKKIFYGKLKPIDSEDLQFLKYIETEKEYSDFMENTSLEINKIYKTWMCKIQ